MPDSNLSLNLVEGSVSFKFTPEAAKSLRADVATLLESLKVTTVQPGQSKRPTPKPAMEYRHAGEVFLEIFCNPNIWPSPFAAKVLITLRDERIRLTTEAELTQLVSDLNEFLSNISP
ncbi:MAG: hypothetical protein WBA10_16170 [Elainellaceae cyanobacterium]